MNNLVKVNKQELSVKEYNGQRVVTLKEIDKVHGRPEGTAGRNFRENRKHFIEGTDYYFIKPSDIQNDEIRCSEINNRGTYLLTESGYLMLAKSFTDDLAWKVQRELVNNYFRPQPECEQLTLETSKYYYFDKTHNGIAVLSIADIANLTGATDDSIYRALMKHGKKGIDYFRLDGAELAAFKIENPSFPKVSIWHFIVVTKSGFIKIMKILNVKAETPKCFIEQKPKPKEKPSAPQRQVSADECITALNVLRWMKEFYTDKIEENKAGGNSNASGYDERTLKACNDIIKQVGMMIAAS